MSRAVLKNMHLPLPEPLYCRLRAEARKQGRPATQLAREAIDKLLAEARRKEIYDSIQEYCREVAGTAEDLDPELEAASAEFLFSDVDSWEGGP